MLWILGNRRRSLLGIACLSSRSWNSSAPPMHSVSSTVLNSTCPLSSTDRGLAPSTFRANLQPLQGAEVHELRSLILFAALIVAGWPALAAPGKRVALIIGNAAYTDITPLQKTLRDAEGVADVLRRFGYDVILARNAKARELEELAELFDKRLKDADVGFFYYSGHGFQTNRADQAHPVNHLVPVDFDLSGVDTKLNTLALEVILQSLKARARVGFVFMDACRNDPQLTAASVRVGNGPKAVNISRGF